MTAPAKTKKKSEGPRLTRDAWLDASYQAVVEGGFDNVRVLVIADALGVTRGSFYWHFADHADLIGALLARWRERELEQGKRLAADALPDPQRDLERLLDAVLSLAGAEVENIRFELALRGFGRRDPGVAKMLVEVDQARMTLFEEKFRRLTGDPKTAGELASLFYLAIVGSYQALSRPVNPPQIKDYLKGVIAHYLIRQQAPAQTQA